MLSLLVSSLLIHSIPYTHTHTSTVPNYDEEIVYGIAVLGE